MAERLQHVSEPTHGSFLRHLWADCALLREDGPAAVARYAATIRGIPAALADLQGPMELEGMAMALSVAGQPDAAVEVDRIAQAHREEFDMHQTPAFWTALRERHVGAAVRAVGETRGRSC